MHIIGYDAEPTKTQYMIVGRSRTAYPPHNNLYKDSIALATTNSFKALGVTLDSKFTFEDHTRSVLFCGSKKLVFSGNLIGCLMKGLF